MKKIILATVFFTSLSSFGATYDLHVIFGDKQTSFHIELNEKKAHVKMKSDKKTQTINLSKKDSKFLTTTIQDIFTNKSNDAKMCTRQYMVLSTKKKSVLGCINSSTAVAEHLTKLANLLDVTFKLKE